MTTRTTVKSATWSVEIEAATDLDVSAADAWQVLADTGSYPEWNPLVTRFAGSLEPGEKVEVELSLPGRKPRRMRPRIVEVTPGRGYSWKGSVGVPGLFDGHHRFEIVPLEGSRCRLVQSETLKGALTPLLHSMLTGPTPQGFEALNEAFAARLSHA